VRPVDRRQALEKLSGTDREIVAVLSEHRVATTQQIQTLLQIPERTARYRLDRLWKLGLCGGRQPFAEKGSAPYHWWPSRLADAFHRGRELPRGGEREDPEEAFLRHSAAITGLYVALHRLSHTLGLRLLSFSREVEARQEFRTGERRSAVIPDAAVVLADNEAEYHALVEVDRGTMSIPRLARKLRAYFGWASSGVWKERHPYLPALLILTTSQRRVEQIVAKAEELRLGAVRRAYELGTEKLLNGYVIAATDQVDRPERAMADPVWSDRTGTGGLMFTELIRRPWERWREAEAKARAEAEASRARVAAILADCEGLRASIQARNRSSYGLGTYSSHLEELEPEYAAALQTLLEETAPMGDVERRAYGFFQRRTKLDDRSQPGPARRRLPLSDDEREAVVALHRHYLGRQRDTVAALHTRYPYLPWLLGAMRRLDEGTLLDPSTWRNRHATTRAQLSAIKCIPGSALDYLTWREREIKERRWNAGLVQKLRSALPNRLAHAIDRERLLVCPSCEVLFHPSGEDQPWRPGPSCPLCADQKHLLSLADAESSGLVEPDGAGYWRVRHRPVPGWARQGGPLPPSEEIEEEQE
jgi:hypothetical protein